MKNNTINIEKPTQKVQHLLKRLKERKQSQLEELRHTTSYDLQIHLT